LQVYSNVQSITIILSLHRVFVRTAVSTKKAKHAENSRTILFLGNESQTSTTLLVRITPPC